MSTSDKKPSKESTTSDKKPSKAKPGKAPASIKSGMVGDRTTSNLEKLEKDKEEEAATKIQAVAHGKQTRKKELKNVKPRIDNSWAKKKPKKKKTQEEPDEDAATKIQAVYRSLMGKRNVALIRLIYADCRVRHDDSNAVSMKGQPLRVRFKRRLKELHESTKHCLRVWKMIDETNLPEDEVLNVLQSELSADGCWEDLLQICNKLDVDDLVANKPYVEPNIVPSMLALARKYDFSEDDLKHGYSLLFIVLAQTFAVFPTDVNYFCDTLKELLRKFQGQLHSQDTNLAAMCKLAYFILVCGQEGFGPCQEAFKGFDGSDLLSASDDAVQEAKANKKRALRLALAQVKNSMMLVANVAQEQEEKPQGDLKLAAKLKEKVHTKDGSIPRPQLEHALKTLDPTFTQEELDVLFEVADKDGDGIINRDEFVDFLCFLDNDTYERAETEQQEKTSSVIYDKPWEEHYAVVKDTAHVLYRIVEELDIDPSVEHESFTKSGLLEALKPSGVFHKIRKEVQDECKEDADPRSATLSKDLFDRVYSMEFKARLMSSDEVMNLETLVNITWPKLSTKDKKLVLSWLLEFKMNDVVRRFFLQVIHNQPAHLTPQDIRYMLNHLDVSKDGYISMNEFEHHGFLDRGEIRQLIQKLGVGSWDADLEIEEIVKSIFQSAQSDFTECFKKALND